MSMTFLIDDASTGGGNPTVPVTITDNGAGSFTFEIVQLVSAGAYVGDLRGFFFDIAQDTNLSSGQLSITDFNAYESTDLTGTSILTAPTEVRAGNDSVKDLGNGANMLGLLGSIPESKKVAGAEGNGYDVGIEIGTQGVATDDVRSVSFTLTGINGLALTMADFEFMDFGVRITSVGEVDAEGDFIGDRDGSSKLLAVTDVDRAITISIADTQTSISEEGGELDTFTISLSEAMNAGNVVTVDVDFATGTDTEDEDFVTAAQAALQAAADVTAGVSFDGTTLTYTDAFGGTDLAFSVQAFNDTLTDSPETLNITLGNATALNGTATAADAEDVTVTDDDVERILNGVMVTNSNVQNQFVTLTFQEDGSSLSGNPQHAAAKIYDLSLQGQQGSVAQDVGFTIDPAKHYHVTLEASAGTKAIVTDLTLEGVVIQGGGNAQLEINNASAGADRTALTAVIDPQTSPIVQAKTDSTDGTAVANTLTDSSTTTLSYLFGADGADMLNGSAGSEVLNGGGGLDTLNGNGGNDILVFDDTANDAISGGAGIDLVRIDAGALALSLSGSSSDTNTLGSGDNVPVDIRGKAITGIEGILITEEAGTSTATTDPNDDVGTTVQLNAADVANYSDTNTLHILGSPGDVVELDLAGGWSQGTLQPMDSQGQAFVLYTATVSGDSISLSVETDVSVNFL